MSSDAFISRATASIKLTLRGGSFSERAQVGELDYFIFSLSVDVFRRRGDDAFDVFHVDVADVADAEGVGFGDFARVEDVASRFINS